MADWKSLVCWVFLETKAFCKIALCWVLMLEFWNSFQPFRYLIYPLEIILALVFGCLRSFEWLYWLWRTCCKNYLLKYWFQQVLLDLNSIHIQNSRCSISTYFQFSFLFQFQETSRNQSNIGTRCYVQMFLQFGNVISALRFGLWLLWSGKTIYKTIKTSIYLWKKKQ